MLYAFALAQVFEELCGCRVFAVACLHGWLLNSLIVAIWPYGGHYILRHHFGITSSRARLCPFSHNRKICIKTVPKYSIRSECIRIFKKTALWAVYLRLENQHQDQLLLLEHNVTLACRVVCSNRRFFSFDFGHHPANAVEALEPGVRSKAVLTVDLSA